MRLQRRNFLESDQSETRIACGDQVSKRNRTICAIFIEDFHRCFLPSFSSFDQAVSEKIFSNRPIKNKNCLWRPSLLTNRDDMSTFHRGSSIDGSYQVSVHLAKRFQRRRIKKNWPIRNKNCLWRPCLLTDRDKMCILYKGPSINASYQVSIHLAK
jgi:hypothetical protein